jgi:GNAT superfamily N-acetyltransferase
MTPTRTRCIRLLEERREEIWESQKDFSPVFGQAGPGYDPRDHLSYIKERHGEKIVAVEEGSGELLGWIAVYPDRDEGGTLYRLSGIEVHAEHRGEGIGTSLMEAARGLLAERRTDRLRFGTSPLLTHCAGLYVTRFGAHYRLKEGVKGPDGRPWPYVSCELSFSDPLSKPLDLRDDEVASHNVLDWDGMRPVPRERVDYTGPLAVSLPCMTRPELGSAMQSVPEFLQTMSEVFNTLHRRGYGFAWFDRSPLGGPAPCYYVMKRLVTF